MPRAFVSRNVASRRRGPASPGATASAPRPPRLFDAGGLAGPALFREPQGAAGRGGAAGPGRGRASVKKGTPPGGRRGAFNGVWQVRLRRVGWEENREGPG